MSRVLHRIERIDWLTFLPVDHIVVDLPAADRDAAVALLSEKAASAEGSLSASEIVLA